MSSLISQTKQIPANAGYYITISNATARVFANTGSDEVPVMNNPIMASTLSTSGTYSLVASAGGVFKDMGKTLTSSGRVFRKVQVVANTGASLESGTPVGTAGVGGQDVAPTAYITGFIELPGQHGSGGYSAPTPVARLG